MKRKFVFLALSAFALTGCSITIQPLGSSQSSSDSSSPSPKATAHSPDWHSGYSYARGTWQQAGYRDNFGPNPSKTEICNDITMSIVNGFNPLNGFQNNKERDFYSGCTTWLTEQGY